MNSNPIMLAGRPRLMQDMLCQVIERTPDVHITERVRDLTRLPAALEKTEATWLVLSVPEAWLRDLPTFFALQQISATYPALGLMMIVSDRDEVRVQDGGPGQQAQGMAGQAASVRGRVLRGLSLKRLLAMLQHEPSDALA